MNLADLRHSPLEIALAEPDAHGVILNRSIYGQEPLEMAVLRGYYGNEILQAADGGGYPEDFRAMLRRTLKPLSKQARAEAIASGAAGGSATEVVEDSETKGFTAGQEAAEQPWRLWRVRVSPRCLALHFYRPKPNYDAARDGLMVFDQGDESEAFAEALAAEGLIRDRICLKVADALSLGLVIRRPQTGLTVDLEVSSSGPGGTHNLRVTVQEGAEPIGTLAFSLAPEKVPVEGSTQLSEAETGL